MIFSRRPAGQRRHPKYRYQGKRASERQSHLDFRRLHTTISLHDEGFSAFMEPACRLPPARKTIAVTHAVAGVTPAPRVLELSPDVTGYTGVEAMAVTRGHGL
jgi:hypothetical protein